MARPYKSQSVTIPAPTQGWNTRDNIAQMNPLNAIELLNFIPRNDLIELRKGYRPWTTGLGGIVKTLYEHADVNGSYTLLACGGNAIWDASFQGPAVSLASPTLQDEWSCATLDGTTVMVNGLDTPRKFTSGGGISLTVFTGITTPSNLIHVTNYRGRLYMIEKNTANIWYGSDGGIAGALTNFPVGKIFSDGGNALFTATWTRETGSASDDLFVIASSNGEILVYTGANPAATDWALVGRFKTGVFPNRRSYFSNGPDLVVITVNGCIPLPQQLSIGQSSVYSNLSDQISKSFSQYGAAYVNNAGWCGLMFEEGQMGIISIPVSATAWEQFVFNPQSKAWCRFTGLNGYSFARSNGQLYFGGTNGVVYQANYLYADNGTAINASCRWAYNYLDQLNPINNATFKQFLEMTPIMDLSNTIQASLGVRVDYQDAPNPSPVTIVATGGTAWDTALWDTVLWGAESSYVAPNYGISGYGKAASFGISGAFINSQIKISALQVLYNVGGFR